MLLFRGVLMAIFLSNLATAGVSPAVIGEVTSPAKIRICGIEIKMDGVLSWTLLSGDRLDVAEAPALIVLNNGTRIIIDPSTAVRIDKRSSLTVNILSGTVSASCERKCETEIEANGKLFEIGVQRATRISRDGANVTVSTQSAIPVFSLPSSLMFKLFPYQTGIHQPEDGLQR